VLPFGRASRRSCRSQCQTRSSSADCSSTKAGHGQTAVRRVRSDRPTDGVRNLNDAGGQRKAAASVRQDATASRRADVDAGHRRYRVRRMRAARPRYSDSVHRQRGWLRQARRDTTSLGQRHQQRSPHRQFVGQLFNLLSRREKVSSRPPSHVLPAMSPRFGSVYRGNDCRRAIRRGLRM